MNRQTRAGWLLTLSVLAVFCAASAVLAEDWPGWGGSKRDFKVDSAKIADTWPEAGPKQVWSRELGDGYSAIAVHGDRLFTMYRKGDDEHVVALSAKDGKTIWEHKYTAKPPEGMELGFGTGPNATPLVEDGRVYTIGVAGHLHCLSEADGKLLWKQDLMKDHGVKNPAFGFSASPIVYKGKLIVPGGGAGVGMLAFDPASGSLLWKAQDFENLYSSPIIINVDGEDQVVLLADTKVVGLDPASGELKWSHPHENQWKTNISTPVWDKDGILYITSGDIGSQGLKLTRKDGKTQVQELWKQRKMAVGQGNVIRVGDHVYGLSGDGPAFFSCADAKTGEVKYRERGFGKAMILYADGKFIVMDESGSLALVKATPEKYELVSKVPLFKDRSWTVPTLIGKTLFVRDKEKIMALDVG